MKTKQTIAVIGSTGSTGSAISKSLSNGNYNLLLYSTKQSEVQDLIEQIKAENENADVEGIECSIEASWEADIIIVAVPYEAEKEVAEKIREMANQKIVISISNPLKNSFNELVNPDITSGAEELQKLLPNSKVVKAFITTFATNFSTPVIDGKQADAFIAGNDNEACKTVAELVATAGFNPIIAGKLSAGRT